MRAIAQKHTERHPGDEPQQGAAQSACGVTQPGERSAEGHSSEESWGAHGSCSPKERGKAESINAFTIVNVGSGPSAAAPASRRAPLRSLSRAPNPHDPRPRAAERIGRERPSRRARRPAGRIEY